VQLCEAHLEGRHRIEIVDVMTDAATAYRNGILVTPTLILVEPRPRVTLLGSLDDSRQVLAALRLDR
jgi:circadian clock protein KaiB